MTRQLRTRFTDAPLFFYSVQTWQKSGDVTLAFERLLAGRMLANLNKHDVGRNADRAGEALADLLAQGSLHLQRQLARNRDLALRSGNCAPWAHAPGSPPAVRGRPDHPTWDAFVESRRDRPYPVPEVPDDGESGEKQQALEQRYFSLGDRRR